MGRRSRRCRCGLRPARALAGWCGSTGRRCCLGRGSSRTSPSCRVRCARRQVRLAILRREEVAVLAGVSVPYYTRLERGDMSGVSESVLEALARALELDDAERAHLFDLARAAQPTGARPRRRQAKQRVRPEVQWTLDAITGAAAVVGNERLDILGANQLGG